MIKIAIHEYSLSVNDFDEPKVYQNAEAIMMILVRLLLLEPGTIQSHPNMGVGLVSKYRYSMEGAELELQRDFKNQIVTYLPNFQGVDIQVEMHDHRFYISATIQGIIFAIMYDIGSGEVQSQYTALSNL